MVSREMERECVVVFDEAHNIDNVCIEALRYTCIACMQPKLGLAKQANWLIFVTKALSEVVLHLFSVSTSGSKRWMLLGEILPG